MQTRIILAGCFVMVIFNNFGTSVEVSSNIDFDSNENKEILNNLTLSSKKSANPPESILRAPKPLTFVRRHGELVKASEPRKRRVYPLHNESAKQPKVINNIQVVVNSNATVPNENSCEYGVCNVSVTSKADEKGNIITEVHLSIVTKAKPNVKVDDVPVINGFRGVSEEYDKRPIFHSINSPRSTQLHRDNIPQIQTNYYGYDDPWYGRTSRQPQIYWNYRFGNHDNVGFRGQKTWPRDRPIVDDKIEPPLSKTKPSDNIKL